MFPELVFIATTAAQPATADRLSGRSEVSRSKAVTARPSSGGVMHQAPTWDTYRLGLAAPFGPLDHYHAFLVDTMWKSLKKKAPLLPNPEAAPSEDGRVFGMTWDRGDHHFEIEIFPSGKYEWFYMDFSSAVREGEDDVQVGIYSREMLSCLLKTTFQS